MLKQRPVTRAGRPTNQTAVCRTIDLSRCVRSRLPPVVCAAAKARQDAGCAIPAHSTGDGHDQRPRGKTGCRVTRITGKSSSKKIGANTRLRISPGRLPSQQMVPTPPADRTARWPMGVQATASRHRSGKIDRRRGVNQAWPARGTGSAPGCARPGCPGTGPTSRRTSGCP